MVEDKTAQKLLLVGLDSAGKTSILNILNEKYNEMDSIKPTVGIERDQIKVLGIPIVSWDLGGQYKYREGYLKNLRIFDNADSLFFVLDIWNAPRFEEALHYYADVLTAFKKLKNNPRIVILIHKVDPNLRENPKTQQILENLRKMFIQESEGLDISIFATSIFDRKSIIEAFSKNLQQILTGLQPFKQILESLVLLLKLDAAILFDEKLMILSDYYKTKQIEELCLNTIYNSVYYMNYTNPVLSQKGDFVTNFELVLNVKNNLKKFTFMETVFREWKIYLLTMSTDPVLPSAVSARFKAMTHVFDEKVAH